MQEWASNFDGIGQTQFPWKWVTGNIGSAAADNCVGTAYATMIRFVG